MWGGAPAFGVPQPYFGAAVGFPLSVLLWRMEQIGAALRSHHCIPEFGSLLLPAQVGSLWGAAFGVITGNRSGVFMGQDLGSMGDRFGVFMGQNLGSLGQDLVSFSTEVDLSTGCTVRVPMGRNLGSVWGTLWGPSVLKLPFPRGTVWGLLGHTLGSLQGAIWGPYGSQCGAEPHSSPHPPHRTR